MNNPLLAIQSQYWAVRDYLSPVLKESKFKEHGRLTPEEFVAAGDFLTFKFPVWQWEKGDPSRTRDFLPADKQYLITRNVPCLRRATTLNYTDADEDAEKLLSFLDEADEAPGPDGDVKGANAEDEWVQTHVGRASQPSDANATSLSEIPDISDSPSSHDKPLPSASAHDAMAGLSLDDSKPKDDEIPDMDDIPDMEGEGLEEEGDDAAVQVSKPTAAEVEDAASGQNLLQVRTYDCLISYDKHYQTPRFWLLGYDENKTPLTPTQVFQDVPSDHAFKTMTMEAFPHSGQQLASVHPCKHASVMKKFIDRMDDAQATAAGHVAPEAPAAKDKEKKKWGIGGMVRKVTGGVQSSFKEKEASSGSDEQVETGLQVDFYLVIFLKFIASIVPTIEVDSTTSF